MSSIMKPLIHAIDPITCRMQFFAFIDTATTMNHSPTLAEKDELRTETFFCCSAQSSTKWCWSLYNHCIYSNCFGLLFDFESSLKWS